MWGLSFIPANKLDKRDSRAGRLSDRPRSEEDERPREGVGREDGSGGGGDDRSSGRAVLIGVAVSCTILIDMAWMVVSSVRSRKSIDTWRVDPSTN